MKKRSALVAVIVAVFAALTVTSSVSATGTWSNASAMPNFATLNAGGGVGWHDHVITCLSAGNCTAAGTYVDATGSQGYVVSQVNGVWQNAITIPGLVALNTGHYTEVDGISCSSMGNCSVIGATNNAYAFVVDQVNGVWGQAQLVQGFNLIGQIFRF